MSDLLPRPLRRLNKSEEGQALVLAALGMIVLLMMAGLGVDVGYLRYQKQQMQKAADAGALAAASAMITFGGMNGGVQIVNAGQSDAAANGFQNGNNGISVVVNNPPQTIGDPFVGKADYVEVIVSQTRPTFFMRLTGRTSVFVSSRAVATAASSASGCVYTLSPTVAQDFVVNPGTQISANCGILVASNSPTALVDNSGLPNNVLASSVGVVGDCTGCGSWASQPAEGIAPFSDPLINLPPPTVPGCEHPAQWITAPKTVLQSGSYCGGITIATNGSVVFSPGTYYLEGGGLTIFNSPNLSVGPANGSTNGVTFYNTNGPGGYQPISIWGTPSGTLSAPTSGDLAGILFFTDRTIPYSPSNPNYINGTGGMVYTGTLYFPTTGLTYQGARVTDPYELIVAWQLTLQGDTTISNHYDTLPNGISPIANATLVE
ncbi:MAG: Tad domain-containing protein [Candidatus Korobacteraceae bacterium]